MFSGPDRPPNIVTEEIKEGLSKRETNKSLTRSRASKIKFSSLGWEKEESATIVRIGSFDNYSPPTTQSPSNTSPSRAIISPKPCADTKLPHTDGSQEVFDVNFRSKVNGRLDSKTMKTHLTDGVISNSVGYLDGNKTLFPTSPLTFIDSCSEGKLKSQTTEENTSFTKHANPVDAHVKSHRVTGNFLRRRSMRTPKSYTSLSDVVEDSDEGAVGYTGMLSIRENKDFVSRASDVLETSNRSSTYDQVSMDRRTPLGDQISNGSSVQNIGKLLESAAAALMEQVDQDELTNSSNRSEGLHAYEGRLSRGHYDKRSVATTPSKSPNADDVNAPTRNLVENSCQDVKSWWMKQISPQQEPINDVPLLKKANESGREVHLGKESFPPSIFATTSHQGVAGRIRRRVQGLSTGPTSQDEHKMYEASSSSSKRVHVHNTLA